MDHASLSSSQLRKILSRVSTQWHVFNRASYPLHTLSVVVIHLYQCGMARGGANRMVKLLYDKETETIPRRKVYQWFIYKGARSLSE